MAANETDDNVIDIDRVGDMPIRTEDIGFAPEALLACEKCGRSNPPTRPDCMYCGTGLEGSTAEARIELRELESWENGFNLIVTGVTQRAGSWEVAELLRAEPDAIEPILYADTPLPLARVEREEDAHALAGKLGEIGVTALVSADTDLAANDPPTRLAFMSFDGDELILELFGKPELQSLQRDNLGLIVTGSIIQGRTESVEKRKRKTTETLSETQTSSDEAVIDIYSNDDPRGWRIQFSGFDFSCLGDDKSLFARENIERLVEKLVEYAPGARVVRSYNSVRPMLEHTWPSEARKDLLGPRPSGFSRKSTATLFSTNNLNQLTKFSRLQWHLR